jgi:hypothetical protein
VDHDRDDELLDMVQSDFMDNADEGLEQNHIADGPVTVSSSVLMGRMPKPDKILKRGALDKLASTHEWKPMQIALTSVGLFFSRPGEDVLRDLIPLFEVVEVKRRSDIPGEWTPKLRRGAPDALEAGQRPSRNATIASLLEEDPGAPLHVLQIRTAEGGYNSGRTYYLRAGSDAACADWLHHLRAAADRAIMLKRAGPSRLRRLQYRLRRMYRCRAVQGIFTALIFLSFLANIAQAGLCLRA